MRFRVIKRIATKQEKLAQKVDLYSAIIRCIQPILALSARAITSRNTFAMLIRCINPRLGTLKIITLRKLFRCRQVGNMWQAEISFFDEDEERHGIVAGS